MQSTVPEYGGKKIRRQSVIMTFNLLSCYSFTSRQLRYTNLAHPQILCLGVGQRVDALKLNV